MDFIEARMLHHLEAQDMIIVTKTEQSERTNRARIDLTISPNPINIGDYVLRLFEHTTKEDKSTRKLLQH